MLTSEQTSVVTHETGHALVSAVAGSGKTTALLHRIEYLLDVEKVPSHRILVLMFNKDARETFEVRLRQEFSFASIPSVQTFHAFALKLLRDAEKRLGYSYTVEEKDGAFESVVEEAASRRNQSREGVGLPPVVFPQDKIAKILDAIQILKNMDRPDPSVFHSLPDPDSALIAHEIFDFYEAIRNKKRKVRLDDLLFEAVRIMREDPLWAKGWSREYDHILVDEYQDSNALQQWMLKTMASHGATIMAVGDEDQCIYKWRGADPGYMTRQFTLDFPQATRYALRWTFRYGHSVALMANHVLKNQEDRSDKICLARPSSSTHVELYLTDTPEEVLFSAMKKFSMDERSILLVREYKWLDVFEWRLVGTGMGLTPDVPGLLMRPLGKALSHLLDLTGVSSRMGMPSDVAAAREYLGWVHPEAHPDSARHIAQLMASDGWCSALEYAFKKGTPSAKFSTAIANAVKSLRGLEGMTPETLMVDWWKVVSKYWVRQPWMTVAEKRIQELGLSVGEFQVLWDNIGFVSGMRATSIHRAKGGGWHNVILGPLEDPDSRGNVSVSDIEEERRLFYVGITRAMNNLILISLKDPALLLRHTQNAPMDLPSSFVANRFLFESHPGLCLAWQTAIQKGEIPSDLWETPVIRRYRDEMLKGFENKKRQSFATGLMKKISNMKM